MRSPELVASSVNCPPAPAPPQKREALCTLPEKNHLSWLPSNNFFFASVLRKVARDLDVFGLSLLFVVLLSNGHYFSLCMHHDGKRERKTGNIPRSLPRLTDNKYLQGGSSRLAVRSIAESNRHSRGVNETAHITQPRMFNLFLFIAINRPLAYVRILGVVSGYGD